MNRFRNRLELAMSMAGITARELAAKTGFSESTISQYRSGYSRPRDTERVRILADALDVSPSWLLGYDESASTAHNELLALIESLSDDTRAIALDYIRYLKAKENTKNV